MNRSSCAMAHTDQRITKVLQRASHSTPEPSKTDSLLSTFSSLEGSRVGRYELIYHIASGGMASVYAGRLVGMAGFERLVAVKIIHPHLSNEPSFVEMFLDEARLAAGISHPNVAEIYEVGEERGVYFMVGELVRGKDLRQVLNKAAEMNVLLPQSVMTSVVASICDGLDEAHNLTDSNGETLRLIHRDVSTRNILISYRGHPKLIDFGAAWAKTKLAHTTNGMVKGKVGYMPPEQLRGESIDHRADIYALGVVLYTVVTGQHPFPYENEGEQIAKALHGRFARPSRVNHLVTPELESIILQAMNADVDRRFQSMAQMKKAIALYLSKDAGSQSEPPSEQLGQLMNSLFADEVESETERIHWHRNQRRDGQLPPSDSRAPAADETRPTGRTLRKPGVVAAVILFTAAAAGFILLQLRNDTRSVPPPHSDASHSQSLPKTADSMHTPATSPQYGSPRPVTTPAADASTVSVSLEGLLPSSRLWIGGKEVSSPILLPQSNLGTLIEVRTPGYQTIEVPVVPLKDMRIQVELPSPTASPTTSGAKSLSRRPIRSGAAHSSSVSQSAKPSNILQKENTPESSLSFESNPFKTNAQKDLE